MHLGVHNLDLPESVIRIIILGVAENLQIGEIQDSCFWPVLVQFLLLHALREQDNACALVLPHHPPEVLGGGWEGGLGSDVSLQLVVSLLCW